MDELDELEQMADELARQLAVDIEVILLALVALIAGATPSGDPRVQAVVAQLKGVTAVGYFQVWVEAAQASYRTMGLPPVLRDTLLEIGAARAAAYADLAGDLALERLSKLGDEQLLRALMEHYPETVADQAALDAVKHGFDAAGIEAGARYKTFVRFKGAAKPRDHHTDLEGTTIPVEERFDIGGYLVLSPNDPELPYSERAGCGHLCVYELS